MGESGIAEGRAASVEGVEVRNRRFVPISSSLADRCRHGASLRKVEGRGGVGELEPAFELQAQAYAREAGGEEG